MSTRCGISKWGVVLVVLVWGCAKTSSSLPETCDIKGRAYLNGHIVKSGIITLRHQVEKVADASGTKSLAMKNVGMMHTDEEGKFAMADLDPGVYIPLLRSGTTRYSIPRTGVEGRSFKLKAGESQVVLKFAK